MIDFRYHLVSIVAVLLALAVGITVGSGVLGDPLQNLIEREVKDVRSSNRELLEQNVEQDRRLDEAAAFEDVAARWITDSRLQGEDIVIFEMEGTDRGVVAAAEDVIARSGGQIASKFLLSARFSLEDPEDRDALARVLGLGDEPPGELRRQAAEVLGGRAGLAASRPEFGQVTGTSEQRLINLVTALDDAGFVEASQPGDEGFVPTFSSFLVVGGSAADPTFDVARFARDLAMGLSGAGAHVLVGETTTSRWGIVDEIRRDVDARAAVATVDQIETVPGRVATVLVFDQRGSGESDHFGVREGATRPIPEPPRD